MVTACQSDVHALCVCRPSWDWDWTAITLNPYFEGNDANAMITDDKFIAACQHKWNFGEDGSGDLRKHHNIEFLWSSADILAESKRWVSWNYAGREEKEQYPTPRDLVCGFLLT